MNFVTDIATDKMLRIFYMAIICSTFIIALIYSRTSMDRTLMAQ